MRILIVEDDAQIGEGIASGLQSSGMAVDWFQDGQQADSATKTVNYDCVVLDLGLPGDDGQICLQRWRDEGQRVPVIVLTARDSEDDKVDGLDRGADDYLVKPVSVRELASRIRAVTRRAANRADSVWRHGPLEYNSATKEARWQGEPVALTNRETALLEVFLQHPAQVLSKPQILELMYNWTDSIDSNALEVFVHNLRRKTSPQIIRTLRGIGYALGPAED